ncbi:MAG: hypothetical protein ACI8TP_003956 [Acidimicrobiales bacterium]|jgi:hypothetical protein
MAAGRVWGALIAAVAVMVLGAMVLLNGCSKSSLDVVEDEFVIDNIDDLTTATRTSRSASMSGGLFDPGPAYASAFQNFDPLEGETQLEVLEELADRATQDGWTVMTDGQEPATLDRATQLDPGDPECCRWVTEPRMVGSLRGRAGR